MYDVESVMMNAPSDKLMLAVGAPEIVCDANIMPFDKSKRKYVDISGASASTTSVSVGALACTRKRAFRPDPEPRLIFKAPAVPMPPDAPEARTTEPPVPPAVAEPADRNIFPPVPLPLDVLPADSIIKPPVSLDVLPERMETEPPAALEVAVVLPELTTTLPPAALFAEPTITLMLPAVELEVDAAAMATIPVLPPLDAPVTILMAP